MGLDEPSIRNLGEGLLKNAASFEFLGILIWTRLRRELIERLEWVGDA